MAHFLITPELLILTLTSVEGISVILDESFTAIGFDCVGMLTTFLGLVGRAQYR